MSVLSEDAPDLTVTQRRHRRQTTTMTDATGGCFVCPDSEVFWIGAHAQAMAARHHDHTGHSTWCISNRTVRYGGGVATPDPTQSIC